MSTYASFSTISEAPSPPHRSSVKPVPISQDQCSSPALHQIHPQLALPPNLLTLYPTLVFHAYRIDQESTPTNVLALLHNATKYQLAQLVCVIIPSLQTIAKQTAQSEISQLGFGTPFISWWKTLLRFLFFVADTNDQIVSLMLQPVLRVLQAEGDLKTAGLFSKQHRSIVHRHEFAMEHIFRAADNAVLNLEQQEQELDINQLISKFQRVITFVLATLQDVIKLADELEHLVQELHVSGLEHIVADNARTFGKEHKGLFLYMCVAWMGDERAMKSWIVKYGGLWGRFMFANWKKTYHEQRETVIETLRSKCLPK